MTGTPSSASILFVCLHGAAKSVIAATHFRQIAAAAGHAVETASAGVEPDPEVPAHVIAGLSADGFEVTAGAAPRQLTPEILREADIVVTLGCDLAATFPSVAGTTPVIRWDGIPDVSDDYAIAREAIVSRLVPLLDKLR